MRRGAAERFSTPHPWVTRAALTSIMGLSLALHLMGIRRDLPYAIEADDRVFAQPAMRIAASGNLNPGWFGHPGSTVIYPLAAVYHVWHAAARGGTWLSHDPGVAASFNAVPGEFYLLGRLVTVGYSVLSLPLAYQVGRLAFGPVAGLIGTWLLVLCPTVIDHAQQVRTDSASMFFTMLTLWLCLRLYDRFSIARSILAGAAAGVALSTKYSLALLAPFLLVVQVLAWWRTAPPRRAAARTVVLGLLAVPLAFAATTPYCFFDYQTISDSVRAEASDRHLGADGLSPPQHVRFYLLDVIPSTLGRASSLLIVIAVLRALWRRASCELLLLGFVAAYIIEVSLHPLHWSRWLIPILPVLTCAAAAVVNAMAAALGGRLRLSPSVYAGVLVLGTAAISYGQARPLIYFVQSHMQPSTRVQARDWIVQNLPPGSRIAQEWYTAALAGTSFDVQTRFSLATDRRVEDYSRAGYRYIGVSAYMYSRYFNEPNRYPIEVAFYRELFRTGRLVQEFKPSVTRSGPTIRVYELVGEPE